MMDDHDRYPILYDSPLQQKAIKLPNSWHS